LFASPLREQIKIGFLARLGHGVQTTVVSAGVLIEHGRVLLTQRKKGSHLAGAWEFPGGKVEPGEDPKEALARELYEELGIETTAGDVIDVTFHRYPERAVLLLFYLAERLAGSAEPRAIDVAAFRWADAGELDEADFPPADVAILGKVRALLQG
jgi:8-oxo-dGTP diphosphatase